MSERVGIVLCALLLISGFIGYIALGVWFNTHHYQVSDFISELAWIVYWFGWVAIGLGIAS